MATSHHSRFKHGHSRGKNLTRTYTIWRGMRQRCHYERDKNYRWYGGKGITVCDRWRSSFVDFLSDMGECPGPRFTIDRIDNLKGYDPVNCRWLHWSLQNDNRSVPKDRAATVRRKCLKRICDRLGLNFNMVYRRRQSLGWSLHRALFDPKCKIA